MKINVLILGNSEFITQDILKYNKHEYHFNNLITEDVFEIIDKINNLLNDSECVLLLHESCRCVNNFEKILENDFDICGNIDKKYEYGIFENNFISNKFINCDCCIIKSKIEFNSDEIEVDLIDNKLSFILNYVFENKFIVPLMLVADFTSTLDFENSYFVKLNYLESLTPSDYFVNLTNNDELISLKNKKYPNILNYIKTNIIKECLENDSCNLIIKSS